MQNNTKKRVESPITLIDAQLKRNKVNTGLWLVSAVILANLVAAFVGPDQFDRVFQLSVTATQVILAFLAGRQMAQRSS